MKSVRTILTREQVNSLKALFQDMKENNKTLKEAVEENNKEEEEDEVNG